MSLRRGDLVKVVAGDHAGSTGKITRIIPKTGKAIVEKVNMVKRHKKPNPANPQGGIVEKEAPIHLSNLMYFNGKLGKTVRLGVKVLKDGTKVRVCKKSGEEIAESK